MFSKQFYSRLSSDQDINWVVVVVNLAAYENILSDHDIVAVLSYIKSQWPKKLIRIHNEQINRSQ